MTNDSISATTVVDAPVKAVFGVLTDPSQHAAIDGTGWVGVSVDGSVLTDAGQVFRMAMYHPNHPDGNYRTANQILVFDPPNAISWRTGYDAEDGTLRFGGWFWRYDLAPIGPAHGPSARSSVTLTYDWSATSDEVRELIGFPPFGPEHFEGSLANLAELARRADQRAGSFGP